MSFVTATTVTVVVTIQIVVVTTEIVTTTIWFAEAILTKRLVEATKSFSPCSPCFAFIPKSSVGPPKTKISFYCVVE